MSEMTLGFLGSFSAASAPFPDFKCSTLGFRMCFSLPLDRPVAVISIMGAFLGSFSGSAVPFAVFISTVTFGDFNVEVGRTDIISVNT